jgi:outer membrane lipoprotein LolB
LRTADRQVVEAADAASLVRRVIGVALPIERLADWVRARPGVSSTVERDAAGRPLLIREEAWRISYEYGESEDMASERLPLRLVAAQEGGPELRLRMENWELP